MIRISGFGWQCEALILSVVNRRCISPRTAISLRIDDEEGMGRVGKEGGRGRLFSGTAPAFALGPKA